MRPLPFVDEISHDVGAPPEAAFAELERFAATSPRGAFRLLTRALGCRPSRGFGVSEREAPERLTLDGRHRFSRYRLAFRVEPRPGGGARMHAVTSAAFPGLLGRAYRLAVIGSGAHVVVARRMLARVGRRAERDGQGTMPGPQRHTEA